ncbi:MAG: polysaccharide deacetylase family protein [Methylobacteriaceae bacterium]|nr:polysaccharide deacetylase family protein [Methylobacteriaceae bacterium]
MVTTSWDDGHPSDLRVADLLEKHGLNGTFYVPSINSEGRPVMSATEIAQLGRRFEIGAHTRDHVSLTGLAPHVASDQILANKHWLEDILGEEVPGFAYVRGHHNRTVRSLVAKAGFRYARTGRNLMSTPGAHRFQVPTTTQFFPHSRSTYVRNYLSGGPSPRRTAILTTLLNDDRLATRVSRTAEACARSGGYFHLWGHSWELDAHSLWNELDRLLAQLRELAVRFVTNAGWCERVWRGGHDQALPFPGARHSA